MKANFEVARTGDFVFARGDWRPRLLQFHPYYFSWSHTPVWQPHIPTRAFRFTVLRDPVSRVVSLFRYLAEPQTDADEIDPALPSEHEWAKDGFEEFLARIPSRDLLAQLYMFSEACDPATAASEIRQCAAWFFVESFDEGMAGLSSALGVPLVSRHDRRSRASADPIPALGELRRLLQPEYDLITMLKSSPGDGFLGSFPANVGVGGAALAETHET